MNPCPFLWPDRPFPQEQHPVAPLMTTSCSKGVASVPASRIACIPDVWSKRGHDGHETPKSHGSISFSPWSNESNGPNDHLLVDKATFLSHK